MGIDDAGVLSRTGLAPPPTAHPGWRPDRAANHAAGGESRILLLTSSLGSGHARAAQAIELALRERNPYAEIRTLDFWSLMDAGVARAVRTAYLRLVQEHPSLFDHIYQLDQHMWRAILERSEPPPAIFADVIALMPHLSTMDRDANGVSHRSDRLMLPLLRAALSGLPRAAPGGSRLLRLGLVQTAWGRLSRRLAAEVRAFAPDAIVATQMNSAALLSSAQRKWKLRVPTVGVPTDFGMHDFWLQAGIGHYCVAHESVDGLHSAGLDRDQARVMVTGIPLMPHFRRPPTMEQARRDLGLETGMPVVLVAGGGLGLGVHAMTEKLLASGLAIQILVIAGHNDSAQRSLASLAALHSGRLQVRAWTDRMDLFIRAADLVVGKPGGLTVAEVLACGKPLLATRALGGQEGFNVRFLQRHGVGRLVEEGRLVTEVADLLANPVGLRRLQARSWALGRRSGADRIAELVQRLARRRSAAPIEGSH